MTKKTWKEFLAEFDPSVHAALAAARKKPDTLGLIGLVNHVMDSSRFGQKSALRYGPFCTCKTLKQAQENPGGFYTHGLPSSASFAEFYTEDMPD